MRRTYSRYFQPTCHGRLFYFFLLIFFALARARFWTSKCRLWDVQQQYEDGPSSIPGLCYAIHRSSLPLIFLYAVSSFPSLSHYSFLTCYIFFRLNIFYLVLEKIQEFSSGKYEMAPTLNDIVDGYESRRSDAKEQIEGLQINQRLISTGKEINKTISLFPSSNLILSIPLS